MTTPAEILAADVADVLARLSAATGIKASDIVRGHGKGAGHVSARNAALWLLRQRGHGVDVIAGAFGHTRASVLRILRKIGIHSRARDMADKARFQQAHKRASEALRT